MPHQSRSVLVLTLVWFARAGGLELGHAWISPHFSLGIVTGFWLEGYGQATELYYLYGELRGHTFHNHRQHRRSHQDQNQHRHWDGLDFCGESSWADLEMADFAEVGRRSKCGNQEGEHTCVNRLAGEFQFGALM